MLTEKLFILSSYLTAFALNQYTSNLVVQRVFQCILLFLTLFVYLLNYQSIETSEILLATVVIVSGIIHDLVNKRKIVDIFYLILPIIIFIPTVEIKLIALSVLLTHKYKNSILVLFNILLIINTIIIENIWISSSINIILIALSQIVFEKQRDESDFLYPLALVCVFFSATELVLFSIPLSLFLISIAYKKTNNIFRILFVLLICLLSRNYIAGLEYIIFMFMLGLWKYPTLELSNSKILQYSKYINICFVVFTGMFFYNLILIKSTAPIINIGFALLTPLVLIELLRKNNVSNILLLLVSLVGLLGVYIC